MDADAMQICILTSVGMFYISLHSVITDVDRSILGIIVYCEANTNREKCLKHKNCVFGAVQNTGKL